MTVAHTMLSELNEAFAFLAQDTIDPGEIKPVSPPGSNRLITLVNWLRYLVNLAGIAAIIYGGGRFGWERFHGGTVESPKIISAAIIGGVVAAMSARIMGEVVAPE
ncbi:hypothetical protein [Nocardia bhagyanarayanae]|uniref:Uncharacterized protein n=1 Tax=Nocardia bhagyanarayanae TaxID=1215925 RepID=A0A543FFM8_9NOCA|nr:hypothetical protein [Nocardia bhagyanarayanae]TQM32675.1 hypothetical protein FB390_4370 [Nocardia bhagyanarayanae]